MTTNERAIRTALAVAAVGLAVVAAGCGGSPGGGSTVQGVVAADAPVAAQVTLKDSSTPAREVRTTADASGAYALDASGLTPPFVLRARWTDASGTSRLYTLADASGRADVNELTDAAVAGASSHEDGDELYDHSDAEEHHRTAGRFLQVLRDLRTVLSPLFDLYGIGADPLADPGALRALLRDVRFTVRSGAVTVTNRATGGVIFTGPLADLASGTFHPENLPAGPGTPPPGTCAYTYSDWGACQADGTQTRTVVSATPPGCTGTPVLSQACGTGTPPPTACTYTYGAWGACQADGTQTRAVVSAMPPGCTGTPVLSQACTPAVDGAALYATYCAGCHGNGKKGSSASAIQNAIDRNIGGMGTPALRALTPAQVAAIAAAP